MSIILNGSNTPTLGGVGYGDGTNLAFTGAGTSGQVLTSAGAGAPTWAAAPGAMILISTATASASSFIDFTGLSSTYKNYIIYIGNCVPTIADDLMIRTSTNNGSSFDSGASNYVTQQHTAANGSANVNYVSGAVNGTQIWITPATNISTTANLGGYSGAVTILSPSNVSNTAITWAGSYTNGTYFAAYSSGAGARLNTSGAVNAIRFFMLGGSTIASGTFKLYGVL